MNVDIDTVKRAEEQARQAVQKLREADARKDEFLAMLAHELRNPLAAVANAAVLLKSPDWEERDWASGVIQRQSEQLAHLIDDLLDVSRITTGKIRLRKQILDVAPIAGDRGTWRVCPSPQDEVCPPRERGARVVTEGRRGTGR